MHHANMVCDVVVGIQKVFQREQSPIETPMTVTEPHKHLENAVQSTHQQLEEKLKHKQTMIQAM